MYKTKDEFRGKDVEYVRYKFIEQLGFVPPMKLEWPCTIFIDKKVFLSVRPEWIAPMYMQHYEVWGPSMAEDYDGDKYAGFERAVDKAIELWLIPPNDGTDDWDWPPDRPMPRDSVYPAVEKKREHLALAI